MILLDLLHLGHTNLQPSSSDSPLLFLTNLNYNITVFSGIQVDGVYKSNLPNLTKKIEKSLDKSYQLYKSVLSIYVFRSCKPFRCFDAIAVR